MSDPWDDPRNLRQLAEEMERCADSLYAKSAEPMYPYLHKLLEAAGKLSGAVVMQVETRGYSW